MSFLREIPPGGEVRWRQPDGGLVIQSVVDRPPGRKGYERRILPGVELGLQGWERAHSQGNITGHESAHGIRYAPAAVNQGLQRLGIERFIRELFEMKASDVRLYLTTTTYTHWGTLRLKEIQYRIDAQRGGRAWPLFEAYIEVENSRVAPRITVPQPLHRTPRSEWERILT